MLRATAGRDRTAVTAALEALYPRPDGTDRSDSVVSARDQIAIPDEWLSEHAFAALRLTQLERDPTYAPFAPRIIVHRTSGAIVGHIGFHTPPGPEYLAPYAPAGIELGYTIFLSHRGHGYATEALTAMVAWANATHGVTSFIVSIAPANGASLRVAGKCGFLRIGEHVDPEDGIEHIFRRDL